MLNKKYLKCTYPPLISDGNLKRVEEEGNEVVEQATALERHLIVGHLPHTPIYSCKATLDSPPSFNIGDSRRMA